MKASSSSSSAAFLLLVSLLAAAAARTSGAGPAKDSKWVSPVVAQRPLCTSQFTLVNHACALLPYTPSPPHPPPSSPPSRRNRRRHRRRHNRRRHHRQSRVEKDCCRWLKEVDDECVCDLLVHLPPFLSRPVHEYTVTVDDSCNVTFQCGSRIKI